MFLERIRRRSISKKKGVKRFYFYFYRKLKNIIIYFFLKEKMKQDFVFNQFVCFFNKFFLEKTIC